LQYDANQNTFMWLEVESERTLSIRRFQPGGPSEHFLQFNYASDEVITALKSVHKVAYDHINSR